MNVNTTKSKKKNSAFRKGAEFLHLWLGLISGIIVIIVCFTAALWVFRDEVNYLAHPEERIAASDKSFVPPSQLLSSAKAYFHAQNIPYPLKIYSITYRGKKQTVFIGFQNAGDSSYQALHLNPYTAVPLYVADEEHNKTASFFLFVRAGHRFLWFPKEIGSPIVGTGCILFLITMITGLIWWYPKKWNASTVKKSFTIKWNANWKRVNIDLHNVFGFYSLIFCCILTITGIAFSFKWFDNSLHYALTGHKKQKPPAVVKSPGKYVFDNSKDTLDNIWLSTNQVVNRTNEMVMLNFPSEKKDYYNILFFEKYGRLHNSQRFEVNTRTLVIKQTSANYDSLNLGSKLYQLNFELHVGNIYGLPTKILAFIVSITGASLPVTGLIIWLNRKRKAARKGVPVKAVQ